ncbi:MAG: peptidylprolyl isomerase [Thermomicrobiales bacterium]|nr:peptidylprolyl isomerase [Thermomicrobiales bacterium]
MSTHTNPIVDITTPLGTISVEIDQQHAPGTAANFLGYLDRGEYDGSRFYRTVTPDNQPNDTIRIAVIQGGMASLDDYPRRDVPSIDLERTSVTGLKHLDGTISMARMTPDSANSEFFICVGDQPDLDFGGMRNPDGQGFAAFGQVIEGMDVVHAINTSPADGQHLAPPIEIVSIKRRG